MGADRFSIAQVSPYGWERSHEVNTYVDRLSRELAERGHRVVVVAPSDQRELLRESRTLVDHLAEDPEALFAPAEEGPRLVAVGQSVPFPPSRSGGPVSLPIDVSRTIEDLLAIAPLDFVHVHEPFAPSAASAALRHSHALNIGSFHSATERVLSTQVARKVVRLLFGRLDGRTASFAATRDLVAASFPGDYRLIRPGADRVERSGGRGAKELEIALLLEEERAVLRLFLRALRRLGRDLPWRATVWSSPPVPEAAAPRVSLSRRLRERVTFAGPDDLAASELLSRADIVVAASNGLRPAPGLPLRAVAAGAIPVAARLPQYEEVLAEGSRGLLFEPRDAQTLTGQLERLIEDEGLREGFRSRLAADRDTLDWSAVADRFEALYAEVAGRRHGPGDPAVRTRLRSRRLVDVDLHMHTDHSHDCATPVEALLEAARRRGLDAIAVTDHNEISGALAAREQAERDGGPRVIVAEEVKTADQGEVIGLFIEEKIARGMSLEETIADIRRQGGVVYVPHPFDRMHSVPDYEHLLAVIDDLDVIEVFNSRVAVSAFNEEAARFAYKYRIPAGAGSDSHVTQGLGSVKIRMRDFEGPSEFVNSLREAEIIGRRQSLLYVQALKFLQTKARPSGSRRTASRRETRGRGQSNN